MNAQALSPPEFPSPWAVAWGQDPYGFWQSVELFGVPKILRWIPPGEFLMGSPPQEPERFDNEDLHPVTLTQGFWLADTACTQALWTAVMGENPSEFSGHPEYPVENVSWQDCTAFFAKVNAKLNEALRLRFPSEAEWEYACRAGTQTVFSWGDDLTTQQANYNGNHPYNNGKKGEFRKRPVVVTEFQPNPWGLYQMHGNVWEWCADGYVEHLTETAVDPSRKAEGRRRVLRGGSWSNDGHFLRSAGRLAFGPDRRDHGIGFRLAGG